MNTTASEPERRQAHRFPLEVALEFDGGAGKTSDVSALGVLFTSAEPVAIGQRFRCALHMSDEPLTFDACVVRVERRGAQYEIAARFEALQSDIGGIAGVVAGPAGIH